MYPSGRVVSYERDGNGRVLNVYMQDTAASTPVTVASAASYLPFGPLTGFTFGSGLAYSASYDADYRLTALSTSQGPAQVQNLSYGYDLSGRMTSITDGLDSSRNQLFSYDALNRLTSGSGAYGAYAYAYDAAGNRTSRTVGTNTPESYTYSGTSNRLQSIYGGSTRSFSYSPDGEITSDSRGLSQVFGYNYDGDGQLSSVLLNGSAALSNTFDGDRHRVEKDVLGPSGYSTQFTYDGQGHVLAEAALGAPSRDYIWLDDMPVAVVDYNPLGFTQLSYVHADHLNRPQKATNPNETLAWDGVAGSFGEAGSASGTLSMNLGFPGQYLDQQTGLYQNWNRDYDPSVGRYVESDPIGLDGGINTYVYVEGDPLSNVDPTGESTIAVPLPPSTVPSVTIPSVIDACLALGPVSAVICGGGGGALLGTLIYPVIEPGITRIVQACDGEDREQDCEERLERDLATCSALGRRNGKRAYKICEAQAMLRYGNCRSGRDAGINAPLPPWGIK